MRTVGIDADDVMWQQNQNSEPISGISSEGYAGKGQVQSAPKKK
jgi:hypothetical protein